MSDQNFNNNKKKKHPIRNTFYTLFVVAVLFLASLFGDIFPGLNTFRDSLLEKQAYSVTETEDTVKVMAQEENEIIIQEYNIFYMGEKLSVPALGIALDEADLSTVTLSDYNGTAKQKTWLEVTQLLGDKGVAINEKIIE